MSNSLVNETSPYLLQHKDNPVEWFSWGKEALDKAKKENKPIFLSVGYSSCHWCHVMAHESFENENIAKIMNDNFVNIKVDREERPDIDDIYQKVCQMVTGQGGWPLSVFLTPNQLPFYVGTYFPILDSYGRPGFGSICSQLAQTWKEKPRDIEKATENLMQSLKLTEKIIPTIEIEKSVLDEAAMNLLQMSDITYGGFGQAPKFPNASNLSFLLRYSKMTGISKFQDFVLKTLSKMAKGGIFDQVGGGFHRYSTDARWLVPHFEKMLYDNALLPIVYAEAYQLTKNEFYRDVVVMTLDYILREMTSEEGGFFSAQDADTNGEEGQTYVWKKKEIIDILGDDAEVFCIFYDVTDGGNFEGNTILANNINTSAIAFKTNKTENEVKKIIHDSREKLLTIRQKRDQPGRDDKILTAWNGLMISALCKGFRITKQKNFLNSAMKAVDFIQCNLMNNGRLFRTYKDRKAKFNGYLEDYSYFINGLLDLFEIEPDIKYLESAVSLTKILIKQFWDEDTASFYFTSNDHESLIIRPKNNYDLSMPSGNSVASGVLLRLYHLVHDEQFLIITTKILKKQAQMAAENPFGFGYLLNIIYLFLQKPTEITILDSKNNEISNSLEQKFLPESIMIRIKSKSQLAQLSNYRFFSGKVFDDNKTIVYVCKDFACSLPLQKLNEVEEYI